MVGLLLDNQIVQVQTSTGVLQRVLEHVNMHANHCMHVKIFILKLSARQTSKSCHNSGLNVMNTTNWL